MKKNKNISESIAGASQKKRSDNHFNVEKFIAETIGAYEDHFSFQEVQNFARASKEDQKKLMDIQKHFKTCEKCLTIYQDIVRFDPYLSNEKPISEGFWESVWQILDTVLPENIQKIMEEYSKEVISEVEGELDKKLFAHMADIEAKLLELINGKSIDETKAEQIKSYFEQKKENLIKDMVLNLEQNLTKFYTMLVNVVYQSGI